MKTPREIAAAEAMFCEKRQALAQVKNTKKRSPDPENAFLIHAQKLMSTQLAAYHRRRVPANECIVPCDILIAIETSFTGFEQGTWILIQALEEFRCEKTNGT